MIVATWYNYAMKHTNEVKKLRTGRPPAQDNKQLVDQVPEDRTDAREAFDGLLDKVSRKANKQ